MSTEEQKKKMWDLALKMNAVSNKQVELMRSLTPESAEANPSLIDEVLDQVDALWVDYNAAKKELDDYRNSVLKGTEE